MIHFAHLVSLNNFPNNLWAVHKQLLSKYSYFYLWQSIRLWSKLFGNRCTEKKFTHFLPNLNNSCKIHLRHVYLNCSTKVTCFFKILISFHHIKVMPHSSEFNTIKKFTTPSMQSTPSLKKQQQKITTNINPTSPRWTCHNARLTFFGPLRLPQHKKLGIFNVAAFFSRATKNPFRQWTQHLRNQRKRTLREKICPRKVS